MMMKKTWALALIGCVLGAGIAAADETLSQSNDPGPLNSELTNLFSQERIAIGRLDATALSRLEPKPERGAAAGAISYDAAWLSGQPAPAGDAEWECLARALYFEARGEGIKGQAALFALDARGKPQLFTDALHVIPHADGTVAIGSTSERDFASDNTTDAQLDALIERARHLVPALKDAPVIDRWAGVRPRSRSRAPMLGALSLVGKADGTTLLGMARLGRVEEGADATAR